MYFSKIVKFNCETLYLKSVSFVFNVSTMFLSADPPLPTITPPPTPTPPPLPTTTIPDRNLMYFYGNNWVMYDLRYVRSQVCAISGMYDLRWVMSDLKLVMYDLRWVMYDLRCVQS